MRIIALSDLHGYSNVTVPDGDVLVIAGDLTSHGTIGQLVEFCAWLDTLPHKLKLVVAGNHDACLMSEPELSIALLEDSGVVYMQDIALTIDGVKFYGSPWMPEYNKWYFMLDPGSELNKYRRMIPLDTNVLITHCPPYGILDYSNTRVFYGCRSLLNRIEKLNDLQVHIFGHIHEQHGSRADMFYNVSICNRSYENVNPPTIIDI